jgi:hypothetical protein
MHRLRGSHRWRLIGAAMLVAASTSGGMGAAQANASVAATQVVFEEQDDCGDVNSTHVAGLTTGNPFVVADGWDDASFALDPSGSWLAVDLISKFAIVNLLDGSIRAVPGAAYLAWSAHNGVLLASEAHRAVLIQDGRITTRLGRRFGGFSSISPDGEGVSNDDRGGVVVATRGRAWRARRFGQGEIDDSEWSPTGRLLAYATTGRSDVSALHLVHVRSLTARRLPIPRGELDSLTWSPNGSWLAVSLRIGPSRRLVTRLINVRTGTRRTVRRATFYGWTPASEVTTVSARATRVLEPTGRLRWRSRVVAAAWSPTGRWLAGTVRHARHDAWAIADRETGSVRMVRVLGRTVRGDGGSARWAPDGTVVLTDGGYGPARVLVASPWTATARLLARVDTPSALALVGFMHASPGVLGLMQRRLRVPRALAADFAC